LSACVLLGHAEEKKTLKYQSWADCLFTQGTQLRQPVYFWAKAWKPAHIGIWEEYGATPLAFLEYMLIGVAGQIELKLSLPIDNRDVESMLRQKVIANNSFRTASLKKKTAKSTALPVKS